MALVMKPEVRHFLVHDSFQFGHESTRVQIIYPQFSCTKYYASVLVDRNQIGRMRDSSYNTHSSTPKNILNIFEGMYKIFVPFDVPNAYFFFACGHTNNKLIRFW